MKKFLLTAFLTAFVILGCSSGSDDESQFDMPPTTSTDCGEYNGHTLYTGPQGGCYYLNSSGNKEYVDRSYCDC